MLELEQEIETFKKENVKISQLKKKLNEEKQKITKEWEEFDKVRNKHESWARATLMCRFATTRLSDRDKKEYL